LERSQQAQFKAPKISIGFSHIDRRVKHYQANHGESALVSTMDIMALPSTDTDLPVLAFASSAEWKAWLRGAVNGVERRVVEAGQGSIEPSERLEAGSD
jgi:hypothetical protein